MIELDNVSRNYETGSTVVRALRGLSLEIEDGEFVAVVGPSGSGKSTLMNVIGALDVPDEGKVSLDGIELRDQSESELADVRGKKVGFVFQTFNIIPTLTALENVELPMIFQKTTRKEREELAKDLLKQVGLEERASHYPSELSGGERQRVAIARALVNDPEIILADEPTGNLDSKTGAQIMEMLKKLNEEQGVTIILVTHNPRDAGYANRRVHMIDGQIKDKPEEEEAIEQ